MLKENLNFPFPREPKIWKKRKLLQKNMQIECVNLLVCFEIKKLVISYFLIYFEE